MPIIPVIGEAEAGRSQDGGQSVQLAKTQCQNTKLKSEEKKIWQ